MIKFVITSEFFGVNEKEESIKNQIKNWGAYDVSITEDGFVTAIMSENNFERFTKTIKDRADNDLKNIVDNYKSIKSVSHDNSFSEFTIDVTSLKNLNTKKILSEIYMAAAANQLFSGIPYNETSVSVRFKSSRTGRIIDEKTVGGIFNETI